MEEIERPTFYKRHKLKVEILGWIGSVFVLIPYMIPERLNQITDVSMNTVGSSLIICTCAPKKAWQPVILNFLWIGATLYNFFF